MNIEVNEYYKSVYTQASVLSELKLVYNGGLLVGVRQNVLTTYVGKPLIYLDGL